MSQLIFAFHCAVVFAVPTLFGWVLLRRVFRESNWLALVPGAFIAGVAGLMAAVNELRFWFAMNVATWFAYKLLLALALLIALAVPMRPNTRPKLPGCVNRGWQLALVLVGALVVTVYFGIPAHGGFLNDAWWHHYPSAVHIIDIERFPLNHTFALDGPLYYHHGPDIMAAVWSFLLELNVQKGWALYVALLAPCSFLLAFALLSRLSRHFWGSLLGASIVVAGGNLRFLNLLTGEHSGALGALQALNSQTVQSMVQMVFTPSHALGIPMMLLLLLLSRHLVTTPSWPRMAVVGLLIGALTLVAEWYFLPFVAGLTVILVARAWSRRPVNTRKAQVILAVIPAVVGLSWGTFNNTYLSGFFGHFWMRYDNVTTLASARQVAARWTEPAANLPTAKLPPANLPPLSVSDLLDPKSAVTSTTPIFQPKWSAPDLVPLKLNLTHFGQVPSWESAASNEDSFIPVFGIKFFLEVAPVLLLGIPFGLWLALRRRNSMVILLAWLATSAALPPIFLDWGYRSTDFLRFFTASYAYSALFIGWLIGELLSRPAFRTRLLGSLLAVSCLITPVGLGVIGLMPGTIEKVNEISAGAKSLSDAATAERSAGGNSKSAPLIADSSGDRARAFEKLAVQTGNYLFPLTHGRDRAIVIVPPDQIPEVKYFPEWMKLATLARLQLPVGWHWHNSEYSAFYREAAARLDARAITSLDAKWVVVSNLFQDEIPKPVIESLIDPTRFVRIATFTEGRYFMTTFRVRQ